MPVPMPEARFAELVADALDQIPPRLMSALDNIAILIDDVDPDDPDLLGVYHGIPLPQRRHYDSGMLPDTITIFRNPILKMCDSAADVVDEVAVTVVHEIGHFFGLDEARLHEMGWG